MLSIMFGVLCIFFRAVVLSQSTYNKILEKSNAYGQVKEAIYSKIDAVLSAKNINYDIKESIITEDDIKREAESAIPEIIGYLKTGENNIKPIDTEIYKQRVARIVHSALSNIITPGDNSLSFNENLNIKKTASSVGQYKANRMMVVNDNSKTGQGYLNVEKLMSKDEAEAKVREILKQKGLTEEQAIQKVKEKGITEAQALQILAGYGITIDGDTMKNQPNTNNEANADNGNSEENSNKANDNSTSQNVDSNAVTEKSNAKEAKSNAQEGTTKGDKSAEGSLAMIENKLVDEADSSIKKEVEKVDLNKILDAGKFKKITKITSIIYKMFWLFMLLPIISMGILVGMHKGKLIQALKLISRAFLTAGTILSLIFIGTYVFKVYEKINIGPAYFKEITSYAIRYLLTVLSMYGIVTFVIGLLAFVPIIVKVKKTELKL